MAEAPFNQPSVNWGRGLFRLWAAASFLWVAGAASVEWRAIRCGWEPSKYGCNQLDKPQPSLPQGFVLDSKPDPWAVVTVTPDPYAAFSESINLSKLSDEQLVALNNAGGDLTKLTDNMRRSIRASLEQGSSRRAAPVATSLHYEKLIEVAQNIIGPPALLLLVGGLLFWAIKGFRRG